MLNSEKSDFRTLDDIYLQIGCGKFHIFVLIILGSIQFFDSVELTLLSFLGPILNCTWKIGMMQSSFLTVAVFIGTMIGSTVFGQLCDIYGRKKIILICVSGILYYGIICTGSPTLIWVIFTRFIMGIFIGGVTSTMMTYLSEIMPLNQRGSAIMSIKIFWSLGSFYIALLTIGLVPLVRWRLWLILSSAPIIFLIPCLAWLPESPRYLLLYDRDDEAMEIINKIAIMNNEKIITSKIINLKHKKPSFLDLCHSNYSLTTVITTYLCFVSGLSYYGFVLSSSIINNIPHKCLQNMKLSNLNYSSQTDDNSCCINQTWNTMKTVFISIIGESLGYFIAIILIRFINRKLYFQILLSITAIVYILINLCLSPVYTGVLMLFGRGASTTMYGLNYLYASEVFPTTIRGFALGFGSTSSRVGSMASSLLVNIIMVKISFLGGTILCSCLNVVAIFLVFLLPYETKDRRLLQSVDEDIPETQLLNPKK